MKKTNYEKVNGKWIVTKRYDEKRISQERYYHLKNEKLRGDRRTFQYDYELGEKVMIKLSFTEPIYREIKSVREFKFEK
ncbi:MAG: hypothetical protein E6446_09030 [Gemella haemolysans]|nr:hypothetical protein [Gemella haemolysans]